MKSQKSEITIVLYPLDRYIESSIFPYENFVKRNLGISLREEVKNFLSQKLNEIRDFSYIWWVFPKGAKEPQKSDFFRIKREDKIIYDEISLEELLFSEKYSDFSKIIEVLKSEIESNKRIKKINNAGFHVRDCLSKWINVILKYFDNYVIEVEYELTDYGISKFVLRKIKEAYQSFQNSHASTKYALALGVRE